MAVTPNNKAATIEEITLKIVVILSFFPAAYSSSVPVIAEVTADKIMFQVHDSIKKEYTPSKRFTIDMIMQPILKSKQKQQICFITMVLMEDLRLCNWRLSIFYPMLRTRKS